MEPQLSKISNLALAVHLLLLLLLHLLDGSLRHIILPDPLLRRLRVVLRVLDLRRKSHLCVTVIQTWEPVYLILYLTWLQ